MKAKNQTLALFVSSLFLLCGCSSFVDAQRLSWIKTADPKRDYEAAIALGDLRFYAVNGFASNMVVGVDYAGADAALIRTHGFRTIAGTSDCSNIPLSKVANKYAATYNKILLRHLRVKTRNA